MLYQQLNRYINNLLLGNGSIYYKADYMYITYALVSKD